MDDVNAVGHCDFYLTTRSVAEATQETQQLIVVVYRSGDYGPVCCHPNIILGLHATQI